MFLYGSATCGWLAIVQESRPEGSLENNASCQDALRALHAAVAQLAAALHGRCATNRQMLSSYHRVLLLSFSELTIGS